MIATDLMQILAGVGILGFGTAGIVVYARDPRDTDEHDVADYRPELAPARRNWPLIDRDERMSGQRRVRARAMADLVLPPIDVDLTVPLPTFAATVIAQRMRAVYGTTSHAEIARQMLAEAAAEQQAEAGIYRSTADRDLVGAFPVVRVA